MLQRLLGEVRVKDTNADGCFWWKDGSFFLHFFLAFHIHTYTSEVTIATHHPLAIILHARPGREFELLGVVRAVALFYPTSLVL
jgi:hypothetical protein